MNEVVSMNQKLKFSSQGNGIPLVFIHGWGVNSAVWQQIIPNLADYYQVITIDLPGFGNNQHIELTDYSIANIAELIVDAIGQPAVYVGWSLGGLVASEIALEYTDHIIALITVASSPCFVEGDNWPAIKPLILKSFHQQLANNPEKTIKGFLKIQAMGSPNVRQDIKQLSALVMQHVMPNQTTLSQSLLLLEMSDYRLLLAKIKIPFLRCYGRLDGLVPQCVIKKIDELAPLSQSVIFHNSSHAPFISEPDTFTEQLKGWLTRI